MSLEQAVPEVHARLFIQRAVFVQLCYVPAAIPVAGDGTRNKTVFTSQRSSAQGPGPLCLPGMLFPQYLHGSLLHLLLQVLTQRLPLGEACPSLSVQNHTLVHLFYPFLIYFIL